VHHFLVKTKEFASKIKFVVVTQETFDSGKLNDSIISLSVKCHLKMISIKKTFTDDLCTMQNKWERFFLPSE
jgi:hypothetical protein